MHQLDRWFYAKNSVRNAEVSRPSYSISSVEPSNFSSKLLLESINLKPVLSRRFPTNQTARIGENVTFQCVEIASSFLPEYRWLHWKKLPSLDERNTSMDNSSYYKRIDTQYYESFHQKDKEIRGGRVWIYNVTKDDEGMYTCQIGNTIGKSSRSAFLRVVDSGYLRQIYSTKKWNNSTLIQCISLT